MKLKSYYNVPDYKYLMEDSLQRVYELAYHVIIITSVLRYNTVFKMLNYIDNT